MALDTAAASFHLLLSSCAGPKRQKSLLERLNFSGSLLSVNNLDPAQRSWKLGPRQSGGFHGIKQSFLLRVAHIDIDDTNCCACAGDGRLCGPSFTPVLSGAERQRDFNLDAP